MCMRKAMAVALTPVMALALAGCFEDQPRPLLLYQPGVYQGAADQPLSAEARAALRDRASRQFALAAALNARAPAAGGGSAASSVQALRGRTLDQRALTGTPSWGGTSSAAAPSAGPPAGSIRPGLVGARGSGLSRSALESQRTRLRRQLGR